MRHSLKIGLGLFALAVAGCDNDVTTTTKKAPPQASLRVVNGFTTPVDVLIDGQRSIGDLAPGQVVMSSPSPGAHSVVLQAAGSGASLSKSITITDGGINTIAAVRAANGGVSSIVLDDTGSVVPSGKTKVRVLHFAPNAGTLQVYRTQPDFQQPVAWQFPFTYQADPNSLSAPFYQSDTGTWEIRVWQTPADASGWANAAVKVSIPLGSGEKRTVVILDKPGGGVRIELL